MQNMLPKDSYQGCIQETFERQKSILALLEKLEKKREKNFFIPQKKTYKGQILS